MRSPGGIVTEVALKVLRYDMQASGQALSRLKDEGHLLSQLQHPAILKVYDLIVLAGRVCLVTEFIDGQDLSRCIRGGDRMPLRGLIEVV
ncbi:MAG TPA: hypothetical protein ENK18_13225, partial [Deltaproteobacteria bacterium]|nr:hypothetical protein [Deltaproteobacteria bacterium]